MIKPKHNDALIYIAQLMNEFPTFYQLIKLCIDEFWHLQQQMWLYYSVRRKHCYQKTFGWVLSPIWNWTQHQIHFTWIYLLFQGSVSSHLNDCFVANDDNNNHCKNVTQTVDWSILSTDTNTFYVKNKMVSTKLCINFGYSSISYIYLTIGNKLITFFSHFNFIFFHVLMRIHLNNKILN